MLFCGLQHTIWMQFFSAIQTKKYFNQRKVVKWSFSYNLAQIYMFVKLHNVVLMLCYPIAYNLQSVELNCGGKFRNLKIKIYDISAINNMMYVL